MCKKGSIIYNLSKVFFQLLTRFFVDRFLHLRLAFVEELLTLRDPDLKLYAAVLPVDGGHDEGQSLLHRFFLELLDLTPVKEKLSRPKRLVILLVAVRIRRYMGVQQPHL